MIDSIYEGSELRKYILERGIKIEGYRDWGIKRKMSKW
jgi:hypothetical protein